MSSIQEINDQYQALTGRTLIGTNGLIDLKNAAPIEVIMSQLCELMDLVNELIAASGGATNCVTDFWLLSMPTPNTEYSVSSIAGFPAFADIKCMTILNPKDPLGNVRFAVTGGLVAGSNEPFLEMDYGGSYTFNNGQEVYLASSTALKQVIIVTETTP